MSVPTRSASSTVIFCFGAPDVALEVRARDLGLERHHRLEGPRRVVGGLVGRMPASRKLRSANMRSSRSSPYSAHLLAVEVHVSRERRRDRAERLDARDQRVVDDGAVLEAEARIAPRHLALQPLVEVADHVDADVAVRVRAELPAGVVGLARIAVELVGVRDDDAEVVRAGRRRARESRAVRSEIEPSQVSFMPPTRTHSSPKPVRTPAAIIVSMSV